MALGGESNKYWRLSERTRVFAVFCEEIFLRCARGLRLGLALHVSNEGCGGAQGFLRLEERSSSITAKRDLGRRHLVVARTRVVAREAVGRSGLMCSPASIGGGKTIIQRPSSLSRSVGRRFEVPYIITGLASVLLCYAVTKWDVAATQ